MSAVVRLRGVPVGEGRAKVAASLSSPSAEDLLAEAGRVLAAGVDVAEWRADHALAAGTPLAGLPAALRARLGETPLLLTVRSAPEGGAVTLDDAGYAAAVTSLLEPDGGDAVDLEAARRAVLPDLLAAARAAGLPVVVSAHDVHATPSVAEIVDRLAAMAATGADIVKLAVTARGPREVLALLEGTLSARETLEVPVVTMAMGPAGLVSRLCGEVFGSALTFGAVDRASAPGQIDARALREVVGLVHEHGGGRR